MYIFFEFILIGMVLNNQMLLSSSRLVSCIYLVAIQGITLAVIPVLLSMGNLSVHLLFFAAIVFILKGVIFPILLLRALKVAEIKREVEPIIGFTASALSGIVMLMLAFWISSKYTLLKSFSGFILPVAIYMILVGLFLIICRRKALMQVMGYLVMENGIYIFGIAMLKEIPLLIDMGVLLDGFVAVFIMGIATYHISQEFESTDVAQLDKLRG